MMERYKVFYQNGSLIRIVEVADANGVLYEDPIVYTSTSAGWGSLISGIVSCAETNLEVVQSCLFDNTTGDYVNLVPFVRYSTLNTLDGTVTYLGDYQFVASGIIPYTVIGSPVLQAGSDVVGSVCYRDVLTGSGMWTLGAYPKAYSVTFNIVSGTPTLTDENGTTNLYVGESLRYDASSDGAGLLTGSLSVTTTPGDVLTVSWTELAI